ncbi:MAG: cupin domain-containing protein [Nitrospinota bacterium]|nr:cupin domain-containing protein [Nitrospinota bacterium]
MMDQDQITKDWNRRSYSCDLWTDPPGQAWENFVHAVDELVMLIKGTIALEIQGQPLKPEPGQEIVIPAVHSAQCTQH